MSSRAIAKFVESRHDTVEVAMERLSAKGLITFTSLAEKSSGGRPGVVYQVGKRDSYMIVAQLSPEFSARLVERWQELKARVAAPHFTIPQTLSWHCPWLVPLQGRSDQQPAMVPRRGEKQ